MADEFSVEISGIEEACAMLTAAPKRIAKAAFARALAAAAVPVVEALEPRIPSRNNLFDEENFKPLEGTAESGTLKDALVTDVSIDAEGKGGRASIGFGSKGYIANFVEYGHHMIGHAPDKKELGDVQPHPFMRPAAAASGEDSIEAFAQSLQESMAAGIPGVPTKVA